MAPLLTPVAFRRPGSFRDNGDATTHVLDRPIESRLTNWKGLDAYEAGPVGAQQPYRRPRRSLPSHLHLNRDAAIDTGYSQTVTECPDCLHPNAFHHAFRNLSAGHYGGPGEVLDMPESQVATSSYAHSENYQPTCIYCDPTIRQASARNMERKSGIGAIRTETTEPPVSGDGGGDAGARREAGGGPPSEGVMQAVHFNGDRHQLHGGEIPCCDFEVEDKNVIFDAAGRTTVVRPPDTWQPPSTAALPRGTWSSVFSRTERLPPHTREVVEPVPSRRRDDRLGRESIAHIEARIARLEEKHALLRKEEAPTKREMEAEEGGAAISGLSDQFIESLRLRGEDTRSSYYKFLQAPWRESMDPVHQELLWYAKRKAELEMENMQLLEELKRLEGREGAYTRDRYVEGWAKVWGHPCPSEGLLPTRVRPPIPPPKEAEAMEPRKPVPAEALKKSPAVPPPQSPTAAKPETVPTKVKAPEKVPSVAKLEAVPAKGLEVKAPVLEKAPVPKPSLAKAAAVSPSPTAAAKPAGPPPVKSKVPAAPLEPSEKVPASDLGVIIPPGPAPPLPKKAPGIGATAKAPLKEPVGPPSKAVPELPPISASPTISEAEPTAKVGLAPKVPPKSPVIAQPGPKSPVVAESAPKSPVVAEPAPKSPVAAEPAPKSPAATGAGPKPPPKIPISPTSKIASKTTDVGVISEESPKPSPGPGPGPAPSPKGMESPEAAGPAAVKKVPPKPAAAAPPLSPAKKAEEIQAGTIVPISTSPRLAVTGPGFSSSAPPPTTGSPTVTGGVPPGGKSFPAKAAPPSPKPPGLMTLKKIPVLPTTIGPAAAKKAPAEGADADGPKASHELVPKQRTPGTLVSTISAAQTGAYLSGRPQSSAISKPSFSRPSSPGQPGREKDNEGNE